MINNYDKTERAKNKERERENNKYEDVELLNSSQVRTLTHIRRTPYTRAADTHNDNIIYARVLI